MPYDNIQFTKAEPILRGMGLDGLEKTPSAREELEKKGAGIAGAYRRIGHPSPTGPSRAAGTSLPKISSDRMISAWGSEPKSTSIPDLRDADVRQHPDPFDSLLRTAHQDAARKVRPET